MDFSNWLKLDEMITSAAGIIGGVLNNFADESRVLIAADWLDENGFPSMADYLRIVASHYKDDEEGTRRFEAERKAINELSNNGIYLSPFREYIEVMDGPILGFNHKDLLVLKGRKWVKPKKNFAVTPAMVAGIMFLIYKTLPRNALKDGKMTRDSADKFNVHAIDSMFEKYRSALFHQAWAMGMRINRGQVPQNTLVRNTLNQLDHVLDLLKTQMPSNRGIWLNTLMNFEYLINNNNLDQNNPITITLNQIAEKVGQIYAKLGQYQN